MSTISTSGIDATKPTEGQATTSSVRANFAEIVSQLTNAATDIDGKAETSHTHTTTDVTDLSSYTGLDARYYTETELDAGQLDTRYYTETELDAGQLDNRYYTETELDAGQLDNRYYTETETDALLADKADIENTLNNQTGTSYTAVLGDSDKMITMSNASANTLTIPANASVAYPVGTRLHIMQLGAGATTVAITTDTLSVNANLTLVLNWQYATATALKITSTQWVLFGNLVAA